jgi:ATP-binding cassette subfamily B protein
MMNQNQKGGPPPGQRRGVFGGGPPGSQQVEKAKDAKGALVKLLKLLAPYKILMVFIVLMTVSATVFMIYSPRVTADFINEIVRGLRSPDENSGIDYTVLRNLALLLGVIYLFSFVCGYLLILWLS